MSAGISGRWIYRGRTVRLVAVTCAAAEPMFVEYKYERTSGNRGGLWRRVREEPVQKMPVAKFRRLFRPVAEPE